MRSNIIEIPHPRTDLWSRARTKIQISLLPGQQDNSNALPPGQSNRSNPLPMPRLPPPGLTLLDALTQWKSLQQRKWRKGNLECLHRDKIMFSANLKHFICYAWSPILKDWTMHWKDVEQVGSIRGLMRKSRTTNLLSFPSLSTFLFARPSPLRFAPPWWSSVQTAEISNEQHALSATRVLT